MFIEPLYKRMVTHGLNIIFNLTIHHKHNPILLEYDEIHDEVKCKYYTSKDWDVIFNTHLDSVEAMIYDVVKQWYEWNK